MCLESRSFSRVAYTLPVSISPTILGHKKQLLQLEQDVKVNNLSHAYLFAGAPHVGKTTVAHWFARHILTQNLSDDQKERVHHQLEKLIHPDLLVLDQLWMEDRCEDWNVIAQTSNIAQQHRAKAGAKTDSISVEDVRQVQERLHETGELPHRVCIIRGVERMQEAAANAFLKILEEPPKGCVFILTTESLTSLLPTVISRARVLRFERVGDRDIQTLLRDQSEEDASFILHIAQGAPGVAFNLMNDPEALRAEKTLHAQAVGFWDAPTLFDRLNNLESLSDRGEKSDRYMFHLALALRESGDYSPTRERAFMHLLQGLKTNAHRTLQIQEFAFACETKKA